MKKLILLLSLISLTYSCSDYLEEENLSNVEANEVYNTSEGFTILLNANYAQLKNIYGKEAWLFVGGTDLYARGRNNEPPGLTQYTDLNPSSQGVDHLYSTCYQAIQMANTAMHFSTTTEKSDILNQQIGEVKYLRANAYFLLVQTYGGVPLITEYFITPELSFNRNSAEEIYNYIITELEESLNLVSNNLYDGHANKRTVQHLLAQVFLTRGYEEFGSTQDFIKAAEYADAAISGTPLTIPFENLWTPGNELNSEVLFSVQYSRIAISSNPTKLGHMQGSYFGPYQGGNEIAGSAPYRTYTLCPTQFAISLYEEGDTRWEGTFMTESFERYYDYFDKDNHSILNVAHYYEPKWLAGNTIYKENYISSHPKVTYHDYGTYGAESIPVFDYGIIPVKKFDDPKAAFSTTANSRDIILSRLGDTYLIAAEAYFKSGDTSKGLERINEVRRRAGVSNITSGQLDIDFILDERAREMLGEYNRWFDLKRTGKLVERASKHNFLIQESNFNGNNGVLKILRPIPQSAIDLNKNPDFKQNPAY